MITYADDNYAGLADEDLEHATIRGINSTAQKAAQNRQETTIGDY